MSQPDATSPEVADAARRAGLPYDPGPQAAGVAGRAPSPIGERYTSAAAELNRRLVHAQRLYGPALVAPLVEITVEMAQAFDEVRGEVHDLLAYRDLLERTVDERTGERDRARDAAVALEQELAAATAAADDATARPITLRCSGCGTSWTGAPPLPRGCPRCNGTEVTQLHDRLLEALPPLDAGAVAVEDQAAGIVTAGVVAVTGCDRCPAGVGELHAAGCSAAVPPLKPSAT